MAFRWSLQEQIALCRYFLKWLLIAAPVAAVVGSACAFFLWLLDRAIEAEWNYPWLLYLLPFAGILIAAVYHWYGKDADAGNNLIMDEIHEPGGGVPTRMAPLILGSTVITHLFGGSAGREGTAVQMGGSIAASFARWFRLDRVDERMLLMTGIAAGFGGVFGTPIAGAVFALEVIAMGRISHETLIACLIASIVGAWSCAAWGIHHTDYHRVIETQPALHWLLLGKVVLAAIAFGFASQLFAELTHSLQRVFKRSIPWPLLRPAVGALIIIGLVFALGTRDYLGLGVRSPPTDTNGVSILASFKLGGAQPFSWWWKILFTAITLSSGFKGGEVTPLFFIGATLGNTLAIVLHAPIDLFAALGFVAVFAGATNTPIACTIMGLELFGAEHAVYIAAACSFAYLFSGHSGIYLSQRIATPKLFNSEILPEESLREQRNASLAEPSMILNLGSRKKRKVNTTTNGEAMKHPKRVHKLTTNKEIGQLRVYLTHGDKREAKTIRERLFRRPLYRDVIDAAKSDGIMNATAHSAHYGYTRHGRIQAPHVEHTNPMISVFVELVATRKELEDFCSRHEALLAGKTIVYKHLEHWELEPTGTIAFKEASKEEIEAEQAPVEDVE